jgi:hypothetical protein
MATERLAEKPKSPWHEKWTRTAAEEKYQRPDGIQTGPEKRELTLEQVRSWEPTSLGFYSTKRPNIAREIARRKNWVASNRLQEPNNRNNRENNLVTKIQILNCSTKNKAIFS